MDELDAMILREILWRPADPLHAARGPRRLWDVARVLGLHGTTVKRRLAAMRESGFLREIHLQPMPGLMGLEGSEHHLVYKDALTKRRAFEALSADPRVWTIYANVGNDLCVRLVAAPGEDGQEIAAEMALDTGALERRFHHLTNWSVPVEKVSALDLRILAAFAEDAYRPISDVAAEVGVAAKTVTSRMRALAKMRAYLIYPVVDYSKISGGMIVYLDLALSLGATETAHTELANRFPVALCRSVRGMDNGYLVLHASGPTDIEEMVSRAQSIPGVEHVGMAIMHDIHQEPARWKDALLARAEELARAKGLWAAAWRARPAAVEARQQ
ncbi:MAG TPA: winged helix-turn-helix transcriptional regulator [Candidatus Thermoplasmatota archaeon]|nr:winged helix-turn-helix transcriptional regulator [Candidatus Thermoplasmatota archaeon]